MTLIVVIELGDSGATGLPANPPDAVARVKQLGELRFEIVRALRRLVD